jgi:hypothetical protein
MFTFSGLRTVHQKTVLPAPDYIARGQAFAGIQSSVRARGPLIDFRYVELDSRLRGNDDIL